MKVLFDPMIPDFRSGIAFWNFPRFRPFVFLIWRWV